MRMGISLGLQQRRGSASAPVYPVDDVGGVAPAFAYSPTKLRAAYSGHALRALRVSDNAELDIGFSGQELDAAALSSFLGVSSGRVIKLYDQSGNGNDTAVQTTDAQRYTPSAVLLNGHATIAATAGIFTLPSIAFSTRATSIYTVLSSRYGLSGFFELETGTSTWQFNQQYYLFNTSPTVLTPINTSISEWLAGAASFISGYNEDTRSSGALALATRTGGTLGFTASGYTSRDIMAAWIGYTRELNTTERASLKDALTTLFRCSIAPTARVVFVGDSITVGTAADDSYGYSQRITASLPQTIRGYLAATGGALLQGLVSGYASSQVKVVLTRYTGTRVAFLHMGTNDLTIGGRTAAQIYADVQSMTALMQADGASVIVSTILPNAGWSGAQQTTRTDLNTLIRDNWASFADGFCDFAADSVMGPQAAASNAALYPDGLHPSSVGHQNLAEIAEPIISALL